MILTFFDGDKVHIFYHHDEEEIVEKIIDGKLLWKSRCG